MNDNLFTKITNSDKIKFNDTTHTTINYVDDSTNLITNNNVKNLQEYIDKFYLLLESYYNINFLKINADNSKVMITCKPKFRKYTKNIVLHASNYVINQSNTIKILQIFSPQV